jgi:O-antigen/teichoic acid export membrane protein
MNILNDNNSGETLSAKVVKGTGWVFALRVLTQLFIIGRLILLARLLMPSDFGLMGIALLVISILEAFSQTGIQQALVWKKEEIKEHLDTAWGILILRGIVLFVVLYFIAPYVSAFFKVATADTGVGPELVIRVIGISILLKAFTNIGVVYFYKELDFRKQFIYQIGGALADFVVSVSAALILKSVWALAMGLLAGNLVSCILSYIIHPCRPRFRLEKAKTRELFGYGKWITGSGILIFFGGHIDDLFVGRLLGAGALGFYQVAYKISNTPASEITYVIGRVAFPAYAKLQGEQLRLRQAYFKIMGVTVLFSIPIAIAIILLARDFTWIFLGEKWLPVVPVMQLVAVGALIKSVVSTGSALFMGSGYPRYEFYMQLMRVIIIVLAIYPAVIYMDISGAAGCVILSMLGMLVVWYIYTRRITGASREFYAKSFGPPLLGSLVMGGVIYLSMMFWKASWLSLPVFIGIGVLGLLVYAGVIYLFGLKKFLPRMNADDRR